MQNTPQHLPPLADYVDLPQLLPTVQPTFTTIDSIKWYVRQHKNALAESGALINVTGRLRYHPERFQQAVVEIGRSALIGGK